MRGSILEGGSRIGVSVGAVLLGLSVGEGSLGWGEQGRGAQSGGGGMEEGRERKGKGRGLGGSNGCSEDGANGSCVHRVGEIYGMEVSRRDRRVESSDVQGRGSDRGCSDVITETGHPFYCLGTEKWRPSVQKLL